MENNIFKLGSVQLTELSVCQIYFTPRHLKYIVERHSTNPVLFVIQVYEIFHTNSTPGDINFLYSVSVDLTFGDLYNHFCVENSAFLLISP